MTRKRPELSSDVVEMLGGPEAEPVVIAVSGGSDSVTLALVMNESRRRGELPPLHLAHLNHRIRGEEARRDAEFVRKLAETLGLPMSYGETDVPSAARERRISLEHAARECRYEFLKDTAVALGARWVALGHTADDQLETVLHHLLRGAGIHGLAGMPISRPVVPDSLVRIVRPLIDFTRGDLIDYLRVSGQAYRTDHTNLDTTYTRNRIRHELVPALEAVWPEIRAEVGEFARVLGDVDRLLENCAYEWTALHALPRHEEAAPETGRREVDLGEIETLEEPMLSYVIRLLITRTLGDLRRIDEVHVRMIADLITGGASGSSLDLPRGLIVRRGYERLGFERGERKIPEGGVEATRKGEWAAPQVPTPVELATPGKTRWGNWAFTTTVFDERDLWKELADLGGRAAAPGLEHPCEGASERMRIFIERLKEIDPEEVEFLDLDRLAGKKLTVRSRRPGDRFTPLGAPGQTKLKDFFIRRKVPRAERDGIPLIVGPDQVLLVAGLGVADGAALTDQTRRILKIRAVREDRCP
jgi:tRNA(Ile)-lysidine synthase